MICLGLDDAAKSERIAHHCREHDITRVFLLSPVRFHGAVTTPAGVALDVVEWAEIIQYKFYYRLLQEIDKQSLVVVNECLRTQNRYALTYNCIRLFLNQTPHALVFQHLPLINTFDDFAVLFDFETRSRWKRERVTADLLGEASVEDRSVAPSFTPCHVPASPKTRAAYTEEKKKLLAEVRGDVDKDPHILPRNLLLVSGKDKLAHVQPGERIVGRNNRFKLTNAETFRDASGEGHRTVFELPHNFIEMSDFLTVSRQQHVPVMVSDTKAEHWYFDRFQAWAGRIRDAQAILR